MVLIRAADTPRETRKFFVAAARHYAGRLGVREFDDARVVLRELFLFLRETRG